MTPTPALTEIQRGAHAAEALGWAMNHPQSRPAGCPPADSVHPGNDLPVGSNTGLEIAP